MLTQERKETLVGILKNNQEIVILERADALVAVNKLGYDFTDEELAEFAVAMKVSELNELDFEQLDNVAGGGIINIACNISAGKVSDGINGICW